jgi:hypothetical protein
MKWPLERSRKRRQDNIKVVLREMGIQDVKWTMSTGGLSY